MINLPVYDQAGKQTERVYSFDPAELAKEVNKRLLHDVVVMYSANRRLGTVKSKSRAEVSGSSKKLYKQKGTGNARAGNKRTPVRRGGGHCFAKRPRDWSVRFPRAARRAATRMAVLSKLLAGQVYLLGGLSLAAPKTKVVSSLLRGLGVAGKRGLIAISSHNPDLWKSCRNIPRLGLMTAGDLNAFAIVQSGFLVVTCDAMDQLRKSPVELN